MGEPAIVLEEAAEQASSQTTRLILIEGGKKSRPLRVSRQQVKVSHGLAWSDRVGGSGVFAVLLYPSSLGPEPQVDRPTPEPVPPKAPSVDMETGCDEGQDPQDECKKIRVDYLTQYEKLGEKNYESTILQLMPGRLPMRGGKLTKPCGHYKEMKDLQQGLKN